MGTKKGELIAVADAPLRQKLQSARLLLRSEQYVDELYHRITKLVKQ